MALSGKRILITRPRHKAADFAGLLRSRGAHPVVLPTIEICPPHDPGPLDQALENLPGYDWLIFTSASAVQAVWGRPALQRQPALPASLRMAAIGPETARSLRTQGVEPDFVPQTYVAEAIVPGLGDLRGRQVLLPQADIARPALADAIRDAGGFPDVVTAYHTRPARPTPEDLSALHEGLDAVTFTSGSTVRNFIQLTEAFGMDPADLPGSPVVACIGPKTARAAREAGLRVGIEPHVHTVEGLVQALQAYFQEQNGKSP